MQAISTGIPRPAKNVFYDVTCISAQMIASYNRVHLKCDGTRWRTGVKWRGKLANAVGNQYPSHYLGTRCIQHYYRWCPHSSATSSRLNWRPPADLNGLVRFARKTKSGFCACAVTLQTQSAAVKGENAGDMGQITAKMINCYSADKRKTRDFHVLFIFKDRERTQYVLLQHLNEWPMFDFTIVFSVHRIIAQIKHQLDATLCKFYFCSHSTCFGRQAPIMRSIKKLARRPLVQVL